MSTHTHLRHPVRGTLCREKGTRRWTVTDDVAEVTCARCKRARLAYLRDVEDARDALAEAMVRGLENAARRERLMTSVERADEALGDVDPPAAREHMGWGWTRPAGGY